MFVIALLLLYDVGRRKTFENTRVCVVYRRLNEAFEISISEFRKLALFIQKLTHILGLGELYRKKKIFSLFIFAVSEINIKCF